MSEQPTVITQIDAGIAATATASSKQLEERGSEDSLGKHLFAEAANPPCGVCHSLEAAGAKGVIGPNLDALKPDARRIRTAIAQGVGAMPAYAKQLTDQEVTALVDFITSSQ